MVVTNISNKKKCPACKGTGLQTNDESLSVRCPVCRGSGEVNESFGHNEEDEVISDTFGTKTSNITSNENYLDKCLHEALEESRPINQKGSPHMLVCNCPKCRTMC